MAHRNRKSGDYRCPTKADGLSEQLLGIVRALSYARTLLEVTAIVRRAVRQLTGADGATFVLREGERVHYVDEDAIGPLWKGRRLNIQACISGWSILHRKTAAIEDITTDPRIPQEAYRTTFVKSLAMVPIRSEDPVGAIGAYWARRHKPTRQELHVLQTLADAAALAFTNFQPLQGRAVVAEPEGNQDTPAAGRPPPPASPAGTRRGFYRPIVIGASAGGVKALMQLLAQLPPTLAAPVLLVIHTGSTRTFTVPQALHRVSALPVQCAYDGEPIRPGRVYVAPPNRHLLVYPGVLRLLDGPAEHFTRPAIDPLFRTAASHYRQRVIGIILSGMLYDGTAGLLAVKMHGGTTIVQDPAEAAFPSMSQSAAKYVQIDHVLTLSKMARLLPRLALKFPRRPLHRDDGRWPIGSAKAAPP